MTSLVGRRKGDVERLCRVLGLGEREARHDLKVGTWDHTRRLLSPRRCRSGQHQSQDRHGGTPAFDHGARIILPQRVRDDGHQTAHVFRHYDLGNVDALRTRLAQARTKAATVTRMRRPGDTPEQCVADLPP
jgi:hypothetical protein